MEVVKERKQKKLKQEEKQLALKHSFYEVKCTRDGEFNGIEINRLAILNILSKEGFYRYDINSTIGAYIFIRIKNKIVEEVSITQIRDFWFNYLHNLEDYDYPVLYTDDEGNQKKIQITKELLINKFLGAIGNYLSEQILDRLTPESELEFLTDTKSEKYVFYRNGFLIISKNGVHFNSDYSKLDAHIWKDRILDRDYNTEISPQDANNSYFAKFCFNISGKNIQRYKALQTIIGYLLHQYRDYKLKAPILTDAFLGEDGEANGRTGKGVFAMGLKFMANDFKNEFSNIYTNINGKNFDPKDKHRFSDCGLNTTTVHIEDLKAYTNIEDFFNDITEGVIVDKKNEKPFRIFPKLFFSTNKSIRIDGGSAKDRTVFYEFADHYSSKFSPQDEFKHWFFKEWNLEQWQLFDCFMAHSISEFFKYGKIVEAETINLTRRTLLEHTSKDFVKFLDYYGFTDDDHEKQTIKGYYLTEGAAYKEFNKKDLFNEFIESYPEYGRRRGFNQNRFTKWVKMYSENSEILEPITDMDERRSNGKDYLTFRLKKKNN